MTIGELINELEQYDRNADVILGLQQRYGTDLAYEIRSVRIQHWLGNWYGEENEVTINIGEQIGTIDYNYVEDEDWENEEDFEDDEDEE